MHCTSGVPVPHKKCLVAQIVFKLKQVVSRNPSSESLLPLPFLIEHVCRPGGSTFSSLVEGRTPCSSSVTTRCWLTSSEQCYFPPQFRYWFYTHKKLLQSLNCRIVPLGLTPLSLLEKAMCRNPGNLLSHCHLWSAGAGLTHTNCVKSFALQTFPNMPFAFHPPIRPHFSTARETLGRSTYQQGCPTWEEYWGLQQLLGVWVPLADVCYSSHFINFGNKTPDYSSPKHPLFDWQPVCVSYDITHCIALATFFILFFFLNSLIKEI